MKVARFSHNGQPTFGIVDGEDLVVLTRDPMFAGFETTDLRVPLAGATLLAPVIPRSKVVGIGKNFEGHISEMGWTPSPDPVMFFKPNTSVIGPHDSIAIPAGVENVQPEGELGIVIGRIAKNVSAEHFADFVFGYTIVNDVSSRALQERDGQWARAKGFDSFAPIGPVIETDFEWQDARIRTVVDGVTVQDDSTRNMITKVPQIVEFVSHVCTLLPGDVISTGSPAGITDLAAGSRVEITIDGIGTLVNTVIAR